MRSWFFRIFAILSLVFIGFYSGVTLFERGPFTWAFRSLPSAVIYSNFFLLNIVQSVIAVFMATDFIKRDKKLDTSEVLFIRPMSNAEYLAGKTIGLLSVFVLLNLLLMLLTSVFLFVSVQVPFRIVPMLAYFFLISIPSLVFITGLSFALMSLIRNQAITFILLLGYIALVLFYLGDKAGYLFDYLVFAMPVPFSDLIGFSDPLYFMGQRLAYLFLGLALISFTARNLGRIPNAVGNPLILSLLAGFFFILSGISFYVLQQKNHAITENRAKWHGQFTRHYTDRTLLMQQASLFVEIGEELNARSEMVLKNPFDIAVDTLRFSINPGLRVGKVLSGEVEWKVRQEELLVTVIPNMPVEPGETISLIMNYSGIPDFHVSYLDVDADDVYGFDPAMNIKIDRKYGFYSPAYVLLTRENLWYPTPGMPYDPSRPAVFRQQFTRFDLTVQAPSGYLPVSQGKRSTSDSVTYHFSNRDPLPQLSLAVAPFREKKLDLDGIELGIAYIEGHDYFTPELAELGDTLKALITEFLDDFERPLGLYYPYEGFTLVETPVQFASQSHSWTSALAESQPQMVFYPEWGFNIREADFRSNYRWMERNSERNKEGLSKKEIQSRVFTNFLKGVFAQENADMRFGPQASTTQSNPYSVFPNYYYYVNYITSEECPVLNYAFERYLMKGEEDPRQMFFSRMQGIGDDEKANLILKEKSLKKIIAEEDDPQKINNVLRVKGAYLLTWIEKQVQDPAFDQFILDYLYNNSFREIPFRELALALSGRFGIELENFVSEWYTSSDLPAFVLGDFSVKEVIDQSQALFVVKTKVSNYSEASGMVKFTFQMGDGGGRRGGGFFGGGGMDTESEDRTYLIEGKQTRELQIVLSGPPRSVIFNTLLSQNIPVRTMEWGLRSEKDEKAKAEEYDRVVDQPVELALPGEIVVDNTDPGFSTYDPSLENPVRKFIEKRKKKDETSFVGEGFGPAPVIWSLAANADYYGETEHSAMVVRSGEGSKTARWTAPLTEAGYYELSVYLNRQQRFGPPGGGRGGGRDRREPEGKFVYSVVHDDGTETIEIEVKDFEDGWNLLGNFYLSSDSASVTLSDQGGAGRVVADAVKWVLQK